MTLVYDPETQEAATMTERRRGLRIAQRRPVKVLDTAANRYIGGQTADICSSGLRLELPAWAPVEPGRTLDVYVDPGIGSASLVNRRNMTAARIVWVSERSNKSRATIFVGVEFLASAAAHLDAA